MKNESKNAGARRVVSVDSETDPFKAGRIPAPFIWGAFDGAEFRYFRETADFIDWITQEPTLAYAHNGGKFDFWFLSDYLGYFDPLTVINGRITKFKIGECEFRDSYAILPVPLAAHDKGEIDYRLFEADVREDHMPKIIRYLERDCRSMHTLIEAYHAEFGESLTLAGGALKFWEKLTAQKAPTTSAHFYDRFSRYYYGGRVEAFRKGIIDYSFQVADINSAYPFAMMHAHAYGEPLSAGDELPNTREETERAFITLRARSLGAFPYRAENGSLTFPNDGEIREFNITGWEFEAAKDTGALVIDDVISVTRFSDTISFRPYVEHFYAIKNHAPKGSPEYILAKLHLNSLYGKLAANPEKYEEFRLFHPSDIEAAAATYGYQFCDLWGPHAVMARPIAESSRRYYNVATGASITGFVRAFMQRSLARCDGVIYCDTDSIAAENISALEFGTALGQWDIEAECDRGGVGGKKLYAFHDAKTGEWKTATKGARLTPDEILQVCRGEAVKYASDVPTFSIKNGINFIERTIRMT